jgi:hypothetical protein
MKPYVDRRGARRIMARAKRGRQGQLHQNPGSPSDVTLLPHSQAPEWTAMVTTTIAIERRENLQRRATEVQAAMKPGPASSFTHHVQLIRGAS